MSRPSSRLERRSGQASAGSSFALARVFWAASSGRLSPSLDRASRFGFPGFAVVFNDLGPFDNVLLMNDCSRTCISA
jgi:hypothetical protein